MRQGAKGLLSAGFAFALIIALGSSAAISQEPAKGNLVGFIFGSDGSTPVPQAVVVVKNVTTGAVTEAAATDGAGVFRLADLPAGLYAVGVRSSQGDYNSQDFFGVAARQTAKITIALNRFAATEAAAAAEVIRAQREKGEAYIGKVVKWNPATKESEVKVEIGLIQSDDRIHIKGQATDFYEDLRGLKAYGTKTKRVASGYTAMFRTAKACQAGDFVYIVCKRGVPPFFLAPLGVAAIVAGAMPLSATSENDPVSASTIK